MFFLLNLACFALRVVVLHFAVALFAVLRSLFVLCLMRLQSGVACGFVWGAVVVFRVGV